MPHRQIDYDLIIFDLDGPLIRHPLGGPFRKAGVVTDWAIQPERERIARELHALHVLLGIATNQGGVGWGMFEEAALREEILLAAHLLNIPRDMVQICFDHPRAKLERYRHETNYRKPRPGMLLELMAQTKIDPAHTLFVGDMDTDREAARQCGCHYMDAADFFGARHLLSWGIRPPGPLDER